MSSIYMIKCKCDKIYIGSTKRELKVREKEHCSECYNPNRQSYNSPVYNHFRECNLERNMIKCQRLFYCEEEERWQKENKWMKLIGSLNTTCPVEDLDKRKALLEKYRIQGKITQNCCCGGTWSYSHKSRHIKTKMHKQYIEEENQKKIKYLQILNAPKIQVQKIHYDQDKKIYVKE